MPPPADGEAAASAREGCAAAFGAVLGFLCVLWGLLAWLNAYPRNYSSERAAIERGYAVSYGAAAQQLVSVDNRTVIDAVHGDGLTLSLWCAGDALCLFGSASTEFVCVFTGRDYVVVEDFEQPIPSNEAVRSCRKEPS